MRPRLTSKRTRARIALALCVLWIASFEILPWLHIALHDRTAAHVHDSSGTIVRVSFSSSHAQAVSDDDLDAQVDEAAAHERGYHVVGDDGYHATHRVPDDSNAWLAAALAHGQHSLAHHGIAIAVPAPVVTSPLPVDRVVLALDVTETLVPRSLDPLAAACRGPPPPSTI